MLPIAYIVGFVLTYIATARWALRDLATISSVDDEDRLFVALWSVLIALMWPVFVPGFLAFKALKPTILRAMERLEGNQ